MENDLNYRYSDEENVDNCKQLVVALVDHILIYCDRTKKLWIFLLVVFGLKWVFLASMRKLLLRWKSKGLDKRKRKVWHVAPLCLFWSMSEEHDQRIFKKNSNIKGWRRNSLDPHWCSPMFHCKWKITQCQNPQITLIIVRYVFMEVVLDKCFQHVLFHTQ